MLAAQKSTLSHVVFLFLLNSVQLLSHIQIFATPWTAACWASLSITNSQSLLRLMSITLVMPSNHSLPSEPEGKPSLTLGISKVPVGLNIIYELASAAKLLQSCPTLCNPIDGSPPGSPIPGILQAKTLEWVAIAFSNAWKWKVKVKSLSRVRLLTTPWTAAHEAPPSMGFSSQEYWSGVPLPSPLASIYQL